jgi:hypothetical protein
VPSRAREILDGVRLRRTLIAAGLAAAAVTGLTACQTKVGLAAAVNKHRLTDSQLTDFVRAGSGPYTDQNSGSTVFPKAFALETWIDSALFTAAVEDKGAAPSAAELSSASSALLSNTTRSAVRKAYTGLGYSTKMGDLVIDANATLIVLLERTGASLQQASDAVKSGSANQQIVSAIQAAKPKVTVSSRYGTWDASQLRLSADPDSGLPSFVQGPAGGASASAVVPPPTP